MTNTALLKSKIKERGVSITALARLCGVSRETLHSRIAGESEFKGTEIHTITVALRLTRDERDEIFFSASVN